MYQYLSSLFSSAVKSMRGSCKEFCVVEEFKSVQQKRNNNGLCGLSPSGRFIVYLGDNEVFIRDRAAGDVAVTGVKVAPLQIENEDVGKFACMDVSDTHTFLGCLDGTIIVVNNMSKVVQTIEAHQVVVSAVSCMKSKLVSGSFDGSYCLWDCNLSGLSRDKNVVRLQRRGEIGNGYAKAIALSNREPTQGLVAYGAEADFIDFETGMCILTLKGHADSIRACTVQDDRGFTAGFDMTARVWDLNTGQELLRLDGHLWFVLDIGVSSDSRRLITSSLDKSCKIYDLEHGGKLLFELPEQPHPVMYLSVSRTARYLLTGTEHGVITLFDLSHGDVHRTLAFCTARHGRLGKGSLANQLPDDVIRRIASFVFSF